MDGKNHKLQQKACRKHRNSLKTAHSKRRIKKNNQGTEHCPKKRRRKSCKPDKNYNGRKLKKSAVLRFVSRFPKKNAIPPKRFKCMPESARICESPAFLKASPVKLSVYSLEPDKRASKRPPASFQPYISRLNCNLHKLRIF